MQYQENKNETKFFLITKENKLFNLQNIYRNKSVALFFKAGNLNKLLFETQTEKQSNYL